MTDLVEFLLARVAEDEAVAAAPAPREQGDDGDFWFDGRSESQWHTARCGLRMGEYMEPCQCDARTRVALECAAKRRVAAAFVQIDAMARDMSANDSTLAIQAYGTAQGLRTALRLLALPHADHPDYEEAWRP